MAKVVVSHRLPIDLGPHLGPDVTVVVPAAGGMARDRLEEEAEDADALVVLLSDRIDAALIARAARLKVVANYAVGLDNVDVAAATERGVAVTHTPDVLTEATADLAFALLLAAARRVVEGDTLVRAGRWQGWAPDLLLGHTVHTRTLGIVGLGRIGQAVARRARGFSMRVLYAARTRLAPEHERELGVEHAALDELVAASDFVSLHCPLSAATRHLIDARALARMKPTAVLINTARGAVVDEAALVRALADDKLAAVGLDVYEGEPNVPEALRRHPRAVLLPHLGSATHATRCEMARMCAQDVAAVLAGRRPARTVNPEVWT